MLVRDALVFGPLVFGVADLVVFVAPCFVDVVLGVAFGFFAACTSAPWFTVTETLTDVPPVATTCTSVAFLLVPPAALVPDGLDVATMVALFALVHSFFMSFSSAVSEAGTVIFPAATASIRRILAVPFTLEGARP